MSPHRTKSGLATRSSRPQSARVRLIWGMVVNNLLCKQGFHVSLFASVTGALMFLAVALPAQAAFIVGGSTLLTPSHANQLEAWLGQGPITLTNIFTKGPGSTASTFHAAADNKGPPFSIMQSTENTGASATVGGYNPQPWTADSNYNLTPVVADRTAFLFNLTTGQKFAQRTSDMLGRYQTFNATTYGPTFGGGHDLYVNSALSGGYSNLFSYGAGNFASIVDGSAYDGANMVVGAVEVFHISSVPIPAALPLLGTALSGFGLLAWRQRVRE